MTRAILGECDVCLNPLRGLRHPEVRGRGKELWHQNIRHADARGDVRLAGEVLRGAFVLTFNQLRLAHHETDR